LKFIIHFIGDIHQPLHIEDVYTGGNDIPTCFRKACASVELHAVWDKYIVHKIVGLPTSPTHDQEKSVAAEWATKLYKANKDQIPDQCADVNNSQQCTMSWATDANAYVCDFVLNVGGLTDINSIKDWFNHRDLSTDYYEGAAPIVEKLIGLAGIRLGNYLNALLAAAQNLDGPEKQKVLGSAEF
jgi:hypothetical protein